MFNIRWRWNATRALAIPRWRSGSKVAPQLQRMAAEDLLALVFPDQVACAENLTGPIEVPAHPLVEQTIRDCLEEAMDIRGLEALLRSIERGERTLIAREMNEPSPAGLNSWRPAARCRIRSPAGESYSPRAERPEGPPARITAPSAGGNP